MSLAQGPKIEAEGRERGWAATPFPPTRVELGSADM